ncbi:hypothetical protein PISMIDRAFT_678602 [Pisolithus microcarpus 441]|uniref:Uncharacterized protein n=1 Tax=Pisolithus microcarpus 441 TaxID=765257 RepID=A0A0C9ZWR6_9AGAM|nr:hypothetical protein BKA83DRAFT_678602 [Pisolithus microcarpus]KIK24093.1 hypothetical protein PISMIDRAFT_678602 [Pisolithus microcarpus 441]
MALKRIVRANTVLTSANILLGLDRVYCSMPLPADCMSLLTFSFHDMISFRDNFREFSGVPSWRLVVELAMSATKCPFDEFGEDLPRP